MWLKHFSIKGQSELAKINCSEIRLDLNWQFVQKHQLFFCCEQFETRLQFNNVNYVREAFPKGGKGGLRYNTHLKTEEINRNLFLKVRNVINVTY